MKKIFISTFGIAALLSATSCKTDFSTDVSDIKVTSGSADFTKYVAIGNSLTSGFRDNALYIDGQNESYPSIIAKQMQMAGGGAFTQPMMPNNVGGYSTLGLSGKYTLQVVGGSLSPVPSAAGAANLDIIGGAGKYFNNMGVPGAKSYHLVASGYGNPTGIGTTANPYFVRFATSATTSVLADAMAQKPTFFSLWIGANDVLAYSTSGGIGKDQKGNVNPATYGANDISDPNVVAGSIKAVLDGLKSVGTTKGVIANIPYVTSIPYFTKIPYNAFPLTAAKAQTLNTNFYSKIHAALTFLGQGSRIAASVSAGNSPVLIIDPDLTDLSTQLTAVLQAGGVSATDAALLGQAFGQARQATANDLILLTASGVLGKDVLTGATATDSSIYVYGISYPIANQYSLTQNEAAKVKTATDAYNASIAALASSYGLALLDANAVMKQISTTSGIVYDGVHYTSTFVSGGSFSLDGVHPTGRGYAVIANEYIKAINATYGSNLPQVNPTSYSGVTFP